VKAGASRLSESRRVKSFAPGKGPKGFLPNKCLGAIKSAEGSQRLTSTNEKEHLHAQNEDQERR
jgi:hypothetical protein